MHLDVRADLDASSLALATAFSRLPMALSCTGVSHTCHWSINKQSSIGVYMSVYVYVQHVPILMPTSEAEHDYDRVWCLANAPEAAGCVVAQPAAVISQSLCETRFAGMKNNNMNSWIWQ